MNASLNFGFLFFMENWPSSEQGFKFTNLYICKFRLMFNDTSHRFLGMNNLQLELDSWNFNFAPPKILDNMMVVHSFASLNAHSLFLTREIKSVSLSMAPDVSPFLGTPTPLTFEKGIRSLLILHIIYVMRKRNSKGVITRWK